VVIPIRFPTLTEIGGALAGLAPFAIHFSTSSVATVNGRVVSSSYLDYVAIVGGALAALAGLATIRAIRRTIPAQRTARLVTILALLGLGAFQILRGVGLVGRPAAETSNAMSAPPFPASPRETPPSPAPPAPPAPPPRPEPPVDLVGPTEAIFAQARDGHADQILAHAAPGLVENATELELRRTFDVASQPIGRYLKLAPPFSYERSAGDEPL
jgi:hypothetical protein